MPRALLVDFYDSFTNNIATCFLENDISCDVIKIDELSSLESQIIAAQWPLVILGPGPGHPSEYVNSFELIKKIYNHKNVFLFGICLGHQIIHLLLGSEIRLSIKPLHGRKETLKVPNWKGWFPEDIWGNEIRVQRYNSLSVQAKELSYLNYWYSSDGELMGSFGDKLVTYQFHPESVGTSGHKCLFSPFRKFLYNYRDDKPDKTERTL